MKLTFLGHREGARVPPEYVGKWRSPLCSGTLHPPAPKKLLGVSPICIQDRCPLPAVWFYFGPCRAYLCFPIYYGNYVWSLDPGSDVRLHAQFCFFSIFELDLATCSRRGLEGPDSVLIACFKRHSSAHIYNNSASFRHSSGVSGRPQEPGQAWGGISVSLLSSLL